MILEALNRDPGSKGNTRKLRKSGYIPGVVYGFGEPFHVSVKQTDFPKKHTFCEIINLKVSSEDYPVIMKEVQVDPLKDTPLHVDFYCVKDAKEVRVSIPLEFVGLTREQEKEGYFKTFLRGVDVMAPVDAIPAKFTADVSHLKLHDSMQVKDIVVPENVKVLAPQMSVIAALIKLV